MKTQTIKNSAVKMRAKDVTYDLEGVTIVGDIVFKSNAPISILLVPGKIRGKTPKLPPIELTGNPESLMFLFETLTEFCHRVISNRAGRKLAINFTFEEKTNGQ